VKVPEASLLLGAVIPKTVHRTPMAVSFPPRNLWCLQACRADVSVGPREHRETMKKPAEHRLAVGQSAVEDPQGRLTGGSRRPAAAAGLLTQCR